MVNHRARKRFGQNFLVNKQLIAAIVDAIHPTAQQNLIEIGPGLGALTRPVLKRAQRLRVVEIDRDLIAHLQTGFQDVGVLDIIEGDVLQVDFSALAKDTKARVFGNLPYNISSPLLLHLFAFLPHIQDMHFMLQKEVVMRLCAQPGSKSYGRLSVFAQYFCQVHHLFNVPPTAFNPQPKVESAIVRLVPHAKLPAQATDKEHFFEIVKAAFAQRRKTLKNNLKAYITPQQLLTLDVAGEQRPEQVTIANFVKISNYLVKLRT